MKKNLFITAILLIAVTALSFAYIATDKGNPDYHHNEKAKRMNDKMREELKLTDEQAMKVEAITTKYHKEIKELWSNSDGDKAATMESMHKLMEEMDAEMKTVLTDDQMVKFTEFRKTMHHGQKGHYGRMHKAHGMKKGMHGNKELHKEIKAYMKETAFPVIQEKRKEFDQYLSAEEKATIQKLRDEFKTFHSEMKSKKCDFKKQCEGEKACKGEAKKACEGKDKEACKKACEGKDGKSFDRAEWKEKKEKMHAEYKEMRAMMEEKMAPIKAIAENHEAELTVVMDELKVKQEVWREEIHTIVKKHMDMKDGDFEGHDFHGKKGMHHFKLDEVHFLLKDPNKDMFEEMNEERDALVYPNPSHTENNIKLEVLKAGNVKVDLMNKDGQLVKTVFNQHKEAGEQVITINISDLKGDTYYYRITDATGVITKRILVTK
jgi:hypothetical protein